MVPRRYQTRCPLVRGNAKSRHGGEKKEMANARWPFIFGHRVRRRGSAQTVRRTRCSAAQKSPVHEIAASVCELAVRYEVHSCMARCGYKGDTFSAPSRGDVSVIGPCA